MMVQTEKERGNSQGQANTGSTVFQKQEVVGKNMCQEITREEAVGPARKGLE